MPTITIPILPLFLALPGLAFILGVSLVLLVFATRYEVVQPRQMMKIAIVLLVGAALSTASIVGVMIAFLPWSTP